MSVETMPKEAHIFDLPSFDDCELYWGPGSRRSPAPSAGSSASSNAAGVGPSGCTGGMSDAWSAWWATQPSRVAYTANPSISPVSVHNAECPFLTQRQLLETMLRSSWGSTMLPPAAPELRLGVPIADGSGKYQSCLRVKLQDTFFRTALPKEVFRARQEVGTAFGQMYKAKMKAETMA